MKHLTFALLSSLILGSMIGTTMPSVFADNEPIQKISNSLNDSTGPFVATDGSNIFLAWTDQSRSGPGEIFFSKSTDGGKTFSAPKNISNKQGDSIAPFLAINGTDIYVAWTYRYPNNPSGGWSDDNSEILFSKSTDGGKTFSPPQKINIDSSFASLSKMAIDGQNVFLTWFTITRNADNSYKNMEIYFSKSTDGGLTFSTPQNLSNNEGFSDSQSIAVDGPNVFIAWSDGYMDNTAVFLIKSTDGGKMFSEPKNISGDMRYSDSPSIAVDGSDIFIAWVYQVKGENYDILFSKSTDGGLTFSESKNISNTSGFSTVPTIVTSGSNIFVTWIDGQTKSSPILFSKSNDGGLTFTSPQTIGSDTGVSSHNSIATDGKDIFNAWTWADRPEGHQELYFSKLTIVPPLIKNDSEEIATNDTSSTSLHADSPESSPNTNNTASIKSIKWLNENGADYRVGGIGVIRLDDSELNVNKTLIDIPVVHVWSDTDNAGIPVDMIETGADTGVFYADITLSGIESSHLQLHVSGGDTMTASFEDKSSDESLADMIKIIYLSPRKQLESGILADQVQCQEGLLLAKNARTGDPMCLKPQTMAKLKERNWIQ